MVSMRRCWDGTYTTTRLPAAKAYQTFYLKAKTRTSTLSLYCVGLSPSLCPRKGSKEACHAPAIPQHDRNDSPLAPRGLTYMVSAPSLNLHSALLGRLLQSDPSCNTICVSDCGTEYSPRMECQGRSNRWPRRRSPDRLSKSRKLPKASHCSVLE